jgi:hypothetical protein
LDPLRSNGARHNRALARRESRRYPGEAGRQAPRPSISNMRGRAQYARGRLPTMRELARAASPFTGSTRRTAASKDRARSCNKASGSGLRAPGQRSSSRSPSPSHGNAHGPRSHERARSRSTCS